MKNSDIESISKLRKQMSSLGIEKTRRNFNELRDRMISPKTRKDIKHIKDLQNTMITPTFRRQIKSLYQSIYRWNKLFAPDTNFLKSINRYNDVQKIRESSLNEQINQFKEITKLRPSFNSELRNLSNRLAQMNTIQLHTFYSKNLENNSTYKNYVNNSNNKENNTKNASIKKSTRSRGNKSQKHYTKSNNTININNNGPVTINNYYNNTSKSSSMDKWMLVLTILGIILEISMFLASNNSNQVTSNFNSWTKSVRNITKSKK